MLLNQKNSEALEKLSEQLDIEGRSLWQDARRRFMHNRAAIFSLFILFLITLFVIFAPMLSPFLYDDTDWEMMSMPPDLASGHYFGTDASGRDLLVRVAIGGRISLMVGVAAALVAVVVGTLYGSIAGYVGGKVDSIMMRLLEIFKLISIYVFCDSVGNTLRYKYLIDICCDRDGFLAGYGAYRSWANFRTETQRVY